jgi:tRNA uridine 5-carboxymethylaminomethyl modification enzyme
VYGKKFIVTTGTFLRGMIHIGRKSYPAGRHLRDSPEVEAPSVGLAYTFKKLRFPMGRATTGTPPRLDSNTIDYSRTARQGSDEQIQPFSFVHEYNGF